jgi:hypothetical protein
MSMQSLRIIALELNFGVVVEVGSGGVSRSGNFAGSGNFAVKYVIRVSSHSLINIRDSFT